MYFSITFIRRPNILNRAYIMYYYSFGPQFQTIQNYHTVHNCLFSDPVSPPQYKTITLSRGPDGLGFSIVGGYGSPHGDLPIYVKTVFGKASGQNLPESLKFCVLLIKHVRFTQHVLVCVLRERRQRTGV